MARSGGGLFGSLHPGAVTIVEPPISRAYARKARVTFYTVSIATVLTTAVVLRHSAAAALVGISFGAGIAAGLLAAVAVVVWPVVRVLWHWSAEITVGLLLLATWAWLSDATSNVWALLILTALAGGLAGWPVSRQRLRAFLWCAITRHRLRMSFAHLIRSAARTQRGSLPLILLARPTPAGERVWVWLRPGLDLAELDGRTDKLAVACWAAQVRVAQASERHAALLRIDVARRDPLVGAVSSPLARTGPAPSVAPVSPGIPPVGLDFDDAPVPLAEVRSVRR